MEGAPVFSWDDLAQYKAEKRFLDGYPPDERTFYAPRDNVHGLLVALLSSAQHSIVVNMFGYDDELLNEIIKTKLADERVYVQMSLDMRQALSSERERTILQSWQHDDFGNSIAVGTSSIHHAISHLKIVIVDGVYTVRGSTNWSASGESEQDNELSLSRNAVIAAETRGILDANHDFMLKQMKQGGGFTLTKLEAVDKEYHEKRAAKAAQKKDQTAKTVSKTPARRAATPRRRPRTRA